MNRSTAFLMVLCFSLFSAFAQAADVNSAQPVNLRSKVGGTEVGTLAAPLRIDPTGTTPQPSSQSGTWTVQPGNTANTTAWKVDGSAVTQPISAASLPLPTGASTSANQSTEITSLQLIDDTVNGLNTAFSKALAIGAQLDDTSTTAATEDNVAPLRMTAQRALHTNLRNNAGTEVGTSGAPLRTDPTGTTPQPASQSGTWTVQPGNTANTTAWKVDGSAVTQPVSAASLPLPAGAATSANQATIITNLGTIDAGIPAALGQTTQSASMPVTIASDQTTIPVKATIKSGGVFGNLSVGTSAVEVKVGASKLTARRLVTIQPVDADLYWGYANTVTTANGTQLFKNQFMSFDADDTATIWLISATASKNARISEAP